MRREIDIYDPIEDKLPQKTQLSPKLKKLFIYSGCAIIGIVIAFLIIYAVDLMVIGAPSAPEAIAEYEKAAILYDADNMIEYSSDYNKIVLYGNRETSDRLLESYLNKAYADNEPQYKPDEISFQLISSLEYEKGSKKYEEIMDKYCQKIENGRDNIDTVAIVKMRIIKGGDDTTRNYIAVKSGSRWFFAYAGS